MCMISQLPDISTLTVRYVIPINSRQNLRKNLFRTVSRKQVWIVVFATLLIVSGKGTILPENNTDQIQLNDKK
jgi:hypothetical protein